MTKVQVPWPTHTIRSTRSNLNSRSQTMRSKCWRRRLRQTIRGANPIKNSSAHQALIYDDCGHTRSFSSS